MRTNRYVIPDSVIKAAGKAGFSWDDLNAPAKDITTAEESGDLVVPDVVSEICAEAFVGNSALKSVAIPDSVTKIGDWAFCRCSSLARVNIPRSVTEIGTGTFWGCLSLARIDISDSVGVIGDRAFM